MVSQAAGVILVLPDGRWVMQRRTDDAPTSPGQLSFFGGSLEPGETFEQGARRELQEETSLNVQDLVFDFACNITLPPDKNGTGPFEATLYRVAIPQGDFKVYEGQGAEAYTPQELKLREDCSDVVHAVLETLFGGSR